jgi:hypothetical protein
MDESLRKLIQEEAQRNQLLQGSSVDLVGARTQLDILREQIEEANREATHAKLQCLQLKKRLDGFLDEEGDHARSTSETFSHIGQLLSTTTSLSEKFRTFEGLLVSKFEADGEERERRILDLVEKRMASFGSEMKRILLNFRDEIADQRETVQGQMDALERKLGQISTEVGEVRRQVSTLRSETEAQEVALQQRFRKVHSDVKGSFAIQLRSSFAANMRRRVYFMWLRFTKAKLLATRHRRAAGYLLQSTDSGRRRNAFVKWIQFAKLQKKQKQQSKLKQLMGAIRYGNLYPIYQKWKQFAVKQKERKSKTKDRRTALHTFLSGTHFGLRSLYFAKWRKFKRPPQQAAIAEEKSKSSTREVQSQATTALVTDLVSRISHLTVSAEQFREVQENGMVLVQADLAIIQSDVRGLHTECATLHSKTLHLEDLFEGLKARLDDTGRTQNEARRRLPLDALLAADSSAIRLSEAMLRGQDVAGALALQGLLASRQLDALSRLGQTSQGLDGNQQDLLRCLKDWVGEVEWRLAELEK